MTETENQPVRRSLARKQMAKALWHIAPGTLQLQVETLLPVTDGNVRVRTAFSGVSRGTERLIMNGAVPASEYETMRAPFQSGDFPFPVKYGYSAAGEIVAGPPDLLGKHAFCLYPHQDQFIVPANAITLIPPNIPLRRATLAANMETALNAVWDSGAGPGDQICVVGAGTVGLLTAHLAARIPGTSVTVVDTNETRRAPAEHLGAAFALPESAPDNCDVVFHTSASSGGLQTAIECAGLEAVVVEMSWSGDQPTSVVLGGAVHSRRLRLISSQVGQVSPSRRPRWSHGRRLKQAIELLDDPALDHLTANEIAFSQSPTRLPHVLDRDYLDLPPVIRYDDQPE